MSSVVTYGHEMASNTTMVLVLVMEMVMEMVMAIMSSPRIGISLELWIGLSFAIRRSSAPEAIFR